jgi:diadenylate cyclase
MEGFMAFWDTVTPLLEIATIAIILNYFLSFLWNTRAMDLMLGLLALLGLYGAANLFDWFVLQKILLVFFNVAVIAILILFQPELRLALSKLWVKGRRASHGSEFDQFLDELTTAVYHLADAREGALIAIELHDSLEEYCQHAVILNAQFSQELVETIFDRNTPLHDGAIVVRNQHIVAAGVILPLADDASQIARWMGTRHRAALGMSQASDALMIAISEESGKVSIAREGIMTRGVKADRFKGIVRSVFLPSKPGFMGSFSWREWLARKIQAW